MPTPMVSFRLDPALTEMMDQRCQDLNISRAEFLRGLIVGALGSPESVDDGGKVAAGGVDRFVTVEQLEERIDNLVGRLASWTVRIDGVVLALGDRISHLERLGHE